MTESALRPGDGPGASPGGSSIDRGRTTSFALWWRQVTAILRLELRRTFLGGRSLLVYLLAAAPVFIMTVAALLPGPSGDPILGSLGNARTIFSAVYQTFLLRAVVFFGCVFIFTNLFRGEVLDRSLHYYFLSPLRREVLVAGKYAAGLVTTSLLFGLTTLLSFLVMYLPFGVGQGMEDLISGPGGGQLISYLTVTLLACVGYGALFTMLGLLFKNPIVPAGVVLGWELIHFLLPPMLKKVSIIYYLKGLLPIPMNEGPFAVVVEPPPTWLSLTSLFGLVAVVLVLASLFVRRMQIRYEE